MWAGRRAEVTLTAVAALTVVAGTLDLRQHYQVTDATALALSLLRAAPLAVVLRRPVLAWVLSLATIVLAALAADPVTPAEPWPWLVGSLPAYLAVLVVAAVGVQRRLLVPGWAAGLLMGGVLLTMAPERASWEGLLVPAILSAIALAGGDVVRGSAEARAGLRTERERRGVLEERARIAREMHDVVAHGMSVVTVRADSAPYRLADVPPATAAEFAEIADAARDSLEQMRRLLTVLRGEVGTDLTAPQPGLTDLPTLVETSRRAGVPVRLTSIARAADPAIELAAYRLVQEALSNALRHAPGAAVEVTVATTADGSLRVEVTNEPPTHPPEPDRAAGHGLTGMRERVGLLGGTVDLGGLPGGGWRVRAVLPASGRERT